MVVLLRSSLRFFGRHPAQLGLSVLGIVLGVGIVTAVLITNSSSNKAFTLSANAITGTTTHQIVSAEQGIPQNYYAELRRSQVVPLAPVIEGYLSIGNELFTLLGIDPFANAGLQQTDFQLVSGSLAPLLTTNNAVLISERTLDRTSISTRTPVVATINGTQEALKIAGVYRSANPAATDGLLISDIAIAQQLLKRGPRIDRVDLVLSENQATELEKILPVSLRLINASTRSKTMLDMTRGFQINLTAMSLLALLVGGFLIHNTMTFSILQRRELFATLRIVGVTSTGIFRSILGETLAISLVGSMLGVVAGYQIARYLIHLTTQTINDLYFVLHVQQIWFSASLAIVIVALGVATSLVAAAAAALEAASISPVQARMRSRLEDRSHHFLPKLAAGGIVLGLIGGLLALLPNDSLLLGFAAMMALIVGYGLAIPWIVAQLSKWLRFLLSSKHNPFSSNILIAFSIGGIQRSISRTGIAVTALTIAVSATFGVEIMIGSFRATVEKWLYSTLQSDIYISSPDSATTENDGRLSPELVQQITQMVPVQLWSAGRISKAVTSVGNIDMLVLSPHSNSADGFDFLTGDSDTIWQAFLNQQQVLISEPLASRHKLAPGDTLQIFTSDKGDQPFTIAGVYHHYGSSHGRITMATKTHSKYWRDQSFASIGLVLKESADLLHTLSTLRQLAAEQQQPLVIRSNSEIRQRSLEVFDRTFQVTRVLRLLTIGVAFIGIFSALLAVQLERAREFAILRASGATGREVALIVMLQTLIMGALAGLLALPLGWLMSEVLIHVINLRAFGWSMDSLLPAGAIGSTLSLAISSACLAGLYPAWRLGTQVVAAQLRDE